MTLKSLAAFLIVGASVPCVGYEIDPEYRSMATQRGFTLINSFAIDSEYQSDLLTYQISPSDTERMAQTRFGSKPAQGHFLASAGSLSATQFDQKLRAEILAPLSKSTRVRFLRTEDENYEEDSSHSILELEQKITTLGDDRGLYIAAYGEISRLKKEDDVGVALIQRSDGTETRLFITQADFTRSERNDNADRFDSTPVVFGIVHRSISETEFREFFVRRESPVRWNDPIVDQTFSYDNRVVGGTWLGKSANRTHSIRAQWDSKTTGLESTTPYQSKRRERIELEGRLSNRIYEDWSFEAGLQWVARTWTDQIDAKLIHENLIPFVWLAHSTGVEAGLETTFFRRWGDIALGSPNVRESAEESRLNLRYRITFEADAELRLALTFDLDGAQGGAFEGGQGQFALAF